MCAVLLLLILPEPGAGEEEPLELRSEVTLGIRFYDLESPFDNDELSGFFDQYRHVRDQDAQYPYHLDFFHADLGLARDDDTHLLRFERWSPHSLNERGLLDLDWKGLRLEADYRRLRNDELRVFPEGTGGSIGVFGTAFTPDTPTSDLLENDRRLYVRRQSAGGELRLRPADFGSEIPILDEVKLFGRFEERDGRRQDRFLLDFGRELAASTSQFRANRREFDQEVTRLGGSVVLSPWKDFTTSLEFGYERFREEARTVRLAELAASDPGIVPPSPAREDRAFGFVPDTDRTSGTLRFAGKLGPATVHGGGFLTRLVQAGKNAPLQRALGIDDNDVDTWSLHGAFDLPLGRGFGVNGFAKFVSRSNDPDESAFDAIADTEGQVEAIFEKREEARAGLELTARPQLGSQLALGYRFLDVERDLDFADPPGTIEPRFNLIEDESQRHTVYLRGRTRLPRRIRLSAEAGYEVMPRVGLARELERSSYVEGRGSWSLPRPIPATLSLHGRWREGDNDSISVEGDSQRREKEFDRESFSWGTTLSAVPREGLVLFASFHHAVDEQQFPHVRSDFPRYTLGSLDFFLDSGVDYESELRTLMAGANFQLSDSVDASLASTLSHVRLRFPGDEPTDQVLNSANAVHSRILSAEARLGYRLNPSTRLELGYRLDSYRDRNEVEVLSYDTDVHIFSFAVTLDPAALLKR